MKKNSIKDADLEKLNGGTMKEIADLGREPDAPRANPDLGFITTALKRYGIDAYLFDDEILRNWYINIATGEELSHEQEIEPIRENRLRR